MNVKTTIWIFLSVISWLAPITAPAQAPSEQPNPDWVAHQITDPLRGKQSTMFTLRGKFLTAPPSSDRAARPEMVLDCSSKAGKKVHGKLESGYFHVGGVVDPEFGSQELRGVPVEFRLDDGKVQSDHFSHSKDYSSVFFKDIDLNVFFYNHFMWHKENTSPPVKKLIIKVEQYVDNSVVMQFDFPASTESVADACGVILHKK